MQYRFVWLSIKQRNLKALFITSCCFKENGDLITGDSNGNIYVWPFEDNRISQLVKHGHEVNYFY